MCILMIYHKANFVKTAPQVKKEYVTQSLRNPDFPAPNDFFLYPPSSRDNHYSNFSSNHSLLLF